MVSHNPEKDPAEGSFLALLDRDLRDRPNNIISATTWTFVKAERLTAGIEVDLDEVLPEDYGESINESKDC